MSIGMTSGACFTIFKHSHCGRPLKCAEAEANGWRVGLFRVLATAGITSLAYDHEISKQFHQIQTVASQLRRLISQARETHQRIQELANQLMSHRRPRTRALSHLVDPENRDTGTTKARSVADRPRSDGVLLRGIEVRTSSIDEALRLPGSWLRGVECYLPNVKC